MEAVKPGAVQPPPRAADPSFRRKLQVRVAELSLWCVRAMGRRLRRRAWLAEPLQRSSFGAACRRVMSRVPCAGRSRTHRLLTAFIRLRCRPLVFGNR